MAKRAASLEGAAINLSILREDGKEELETLLDGLPGRKCLVLENQIGALLNHILPEGTKFLKDKGVVYFNELSHTLGEFLDPSSGLPSPPDHIVYLVRPTLPNVKLIADQINRRTKQPGVPYDFRYKVFFVPQRSLVCERALQEEGVMRRVDVGEYPLDLIPLDRDLLSLELPAVFRDCHLDGDTSALATVARSLQKLQTVFGVIPNVKSKGSTSRLVLQKAMAMRVAEADEQDTPVGPDIDTLVILDREVDLASSLATPLTYEGLVDELLGITNGYVRLDADVVEAGDADPKETPQQRRERFLGPDGQKRQVPVPLNSNDLLFSVIRDLNVEQLGPFLQEKAKEIRESYSTFRSNRDQSITEIHQFVKKIPGLTQNYKSLAQHINVAELIKRTTDSAEFRQRWQSERTMLEGDTCYDDIEEHINMQSPPLLVLRLLCLQSVTNGGIRSNKYDFFKREIIQTYGYEYMFTLSNLERVGLLRRREMAWVDSGSAWGMLRRSLRLINDAVNVNAPDDISYVSSGYAPLSVRLIQALNRPGWPGCAEVLRQLPGPTLEITQSHRPEDLANALQRQQASPDPGGGGGKADGPEGEGQGRAGAPVLGGAMGGTNPPVRKKVMLVYFVGGLTYMEMAAMRFLSRQRDFPYEIVMATTRIINGSSFLKSLMQDMGSPNT